MLEINDHTPGPKEKLLAESLNAEENNENNSPTISYGPRMKQINLLEEEDKNLPHRQKLDLLRHRSPRFSSDLKFWPLFDTRVLSRYSFAYYYYYELYYFLVKFLALMAVLAIGYFAISYFLQSNQNHEVGLWVFFAYSLVTMIIIRLCVMGEEKRVMKKRNNQAEDWTENKFSLLVENLPIAATKEEIKEFFEKRLIESGIEDKIKSIIFLQDCRIYKRLEKELRKNTYEYKKSYTNDQDIIDNIIGIETQIDTILRAVQEYQLYQGKAIIIFETVRGKIAIQNFFHNSKLKRAFFTLLPKVAAKKYRFKDHLLKVKEAPEPSDIFFEKIHIPSYILYGRKLLAYVLSSIAVMIGVSIMILIRVGQNENDPEYQYPLVTYSLILIGTTLAIYFFSDLILEKVMISKTKTAHETERLKIRLVITYFNINFYLVVLMQSVPEFEVFNYQMFVTALILVIIIPLRKLIALVSPRKLWKRRNLYRDPNSFERYTQQEIVDIFTSPEYDFANNIEDSVCFIFFAIGFYFIGHLYVVIIIFIGLLVCICIDKWIMINFTSPTRIKGAEMGLEFFRIFGWDLRLQLLTLVFVPSLAFAPATIPTALRSVIFGFYCLFWFWDFRGNLRKKWKKKWSKEREMTKYEDVKEFFQHNYVAEYPYEVY